MAHNSLARQRPLVAAFGEFDRAAFERLAVGRGDLDSVGGREVGARLGGRGALSDTRGKIACTSGRRTKSSVSSRKTDIAGAQRRGHRKLHGEFRFEPGLRPAVAQHQHLRLAGRDMNALDLVRA